MYNKTNLRIASLIPGEGRYGYQGIHITDDYTEVTNGHYLMRVDSVRKDEHDELPEREGLKPSKDKVDCIIDATVSKEIERAIPVVRHMPILQHTWVIQGGKESNQVKFGTTDLEHDKILIANKIEEKYANTDKVFKDAKKEKVITKISFNAEYMEKLCQQFKKAEIKMVTLTIHGDKKVMELKGENIEEQQKITALLMPGIV